MLTGDLLDKVETNQQSENILALAQIPDHNVSVTPHFNLNSARSVIPESDLMYRPDRNIPEHLRDDSVVTGEIIRFR